MDGAAQSASTQRRLRKQACPLHLQHMRSNASFCSCAATLIALLVAFSINFVLVAFVAQDDAFAEVRKADVIAGITVEQRGLSVASCPSIDAQHAILVSDDGSVLFERDAQSPAQIASITKVMTAIVAIDNAQEGTYVVVSEDAASIGESSANLQQGDLMDFETALMALLVPSGNDAALALAETVGAQMIASDPSLGNDSVKAFVAAMNEKAAEIGCTDTVYENPHGLDDEQFAGDLHSTAADQALVAKCAMSYDVIREIVKGGSTTIKVERDGSKKKIELETTDELLEMYEPTIGIKTGMTNAAGYSFMGAASQDGRELYAVVLGSSDSMQRFYDAQALFEWAYEHVDVIDLANTEVTTSMDAAGISGEVPVIADVSHADWTDRTVKATLADPDAQVSVFDIEGNVSQSVNLDELSGTVRAGDKVGTITFKQRNMVVAEQDLIACETVDAPNALDAIAVWWKRLVAGFDGSDTQAETKIYNVMPIISDNKSNAA